MRCKKYIKPLLYLALISAIIFTTPVSFFYSKVDEYTDILYWIGSVYTISSLTFVIVESLLTILTSLVRYCRKRQQVVWNVETHKYQTMTTKDITLINEVKEVIITSLPNGSVPVSRFDGENTTVVRPPDPTVLILLCAHLEASQDTILDTLTALRDIHAKNDTVHVVVAHDAHEFKIRENLIRRIDEFHAMYMTRGKALTRIECQSESRADAIYHVSKLIVESKLPRSNYIAILDAEQRPERYTLIRALDILTTKDVDILQGRCIIRNTQCWLGALAAVEFDLLYAMHHKGGEVIRGDNTFGNSNCWMTMATFLDVGVRREMICDDLDMCLRASMMGYDVCYNSNVVIYEPAPDTVKKLWLQRVKWARGWFQVAISTLTRILACTKKGPSLSVRWFLFQLIIYHEIFYYPSAQVLPILLSSLAKSAYKLNFYIFLSSCVTLLILPVQMIIVKFHLKLDVDRIAPDDYHPVSWKMYLIYFLLSPVYTYFKFLCYVFGHIQELSL